MHKTITKYNTEEIQKSIGDLENVAVSLNDVCVKGSQLISIRYLPKPEGILPEDDDGSQENMIEISLAMDGGCTATAYFYPDYQTCEVWHELADLLIFKIQDTKKYIEQQREYLGWLEKEYDTYMSK